MANDDGQKNIYYLKNIETYLKSDEPVVSQEKRKTIEEKLELQK